MSSPRRNLVFAVLLLVLAGIVAGGLHGCHSDSDHQSQANCVLCSCASAPAISTGHEPLVTTLVVSRRVAIPPAPVPDQFFWPLPLSSRAPPAAAIA